MVRQDKADKVKQDVDDAVSYTISGDSRPNSNGISIYMPTTSDAIATTYRSATISTNQFYSNYLEQDTVAPILNLQIEVKTPRKKWLLLD